MKTSRRDLMKKNNISMEQFIASCAEIGLKGVEMIGEEHWPLLKKDTTAWCAELINRVNSPRVKVLCDV